MPGAAYYIGQTEVPYLTRVQKSFFQSKVLSKRCGTDFFSDDAGEFAEGSSTKNSSAKLLRSALLKFLIDLMSCAGMLGM